VVVVSDGKKESDLGVDWMDAEQELREVLDRSRDDSLVLVDSAEGESGEYGEGSGLL